MPRSELIARYSEERSQVNETPDRKYQIQKQQNFQDKAIFKVQKAISDR